MWETYVYCCLQDLTRVTVTISGEGLVITTGIVLQHAYGGVTVCLYLEGQRPPLAERVEGERGVACAVAWRRRRRAPLPQLQRPEQPRHVLVAWTPLSHGTAGAGASVLQRAHVHHAVLHRRHPDDPTEPGACARTGPRYDAEGRRSGFSTRSVSLYYLVIRPWWI